MRLDSLAAGSAPAVARVFRGGVVIAVALDSVQLLGIVILGFCAGFILSELTR